MRQKVPETYEEKLAQLEELRNQAVHAGSEEAVSKQHAKGKYTARERVEKLLDPGSFKELDAFARHRTYDFDMHKKRPWGDAVHLLCRVPADVAEFDHAGAWVEVEPEPALLPVGQRPVVARALVHPPLPREPLSQRNTGVRDRG